MLRNLGLTEPEKYKVLDELMTTENCLFSDSLISDSLRGRVFYCWDCKELKDVNLGFYLKPNYDITVGFEDCTPSLFRRAQNGAGRIFDDTEHVLGRCDTCGYSSCRYHTAADSTEILIVYCNFCSVDTVACMDCITNFRWTCPCGGVYNNVNQPKLKQSPDSPESFEETDDSE